MHDSGTLNEEEFASLSSRILQGEPVPETPDGASATRGTVASDKGLDTNRSE